MRNIFCLAFVFFFVSCGRYNPQNYYEDSFNAFKSFMYEDGLEDSLLNTFKLFSVNEDSTSYRYEWFKISDSQDSIFTSVKIEKKWPYATSGCSCSISIGLLKKKRCSLRNLFDTTIVTHKNVDHFIEIGENDTIDWIVNKAKIIDHIREGHYTILKNSTAPYIIEFYIYIGVTEKGRYKIETASVQFKENNIIEVTPIYLPDSFFNEQHSETNRKIYEYKVE